MSAYVFSGLSPFVQRAAAERDINAVHLVKCETIWHCSQVQNALGQVPRIDMAHRGSLIKHAEDIRESLAAVLAGIDAAIAEVKYECGMVEPADTKPIRLRDDAPAGVANTDTIPRAAHDPRTNRPRPGKQPEHPHTAAVAAEG